MFRGWVVLRILDRVQHVPIAIILQFITTIGVWQLAVTTILWDAKCAQRANVRVARASPRSQMTNLRLQRPFGTSSRRISPPIRIAPTPSIRRTPHTTIFTRRLASAREAVLAMRANDEIGDDAFHLIEEELDWIEMAGGAWD